MQNSVNFLLFSLCKTTPTKLYSGIDIGTYLSIRDFQEGKKLHTKKKNEFKQVVIFLYCSISGEVMPTCTVYMLL